MRVEKKVFTRDQSGKEVYVYTLSNAAGMQVDICEIGATVVSLRVPDRQGNCRDVVLGYEKPEVYFQNWLVFGSVVGRCANRIGTGSFTLNGVTYQLEKGRDGVTLHSGSQGYQFRVWNSKSYADDESASVTFSLHSPDGDQGFPGNLDIKVTYRLDQKNELSIIYDGVSDKDTLINLTNHCYFNLNGHQSGNIWNHQLRIDSDAVCILDEKNLPTGELLSVEGTPYDFRKKKAVGRDVSILEHPVSVLLQGLLPKKKSKADEDKNEITEYDVNYKINKGFGTKRVVAEVEGDQSGIIMEISTDLPGLQMYTAGLLNGRKFGKEGAAYVRYGAICLETQFFPDAIHHPEFVQPVFKAGERFLSETTYRFSVDTRGAGSESE